MLRPRRVVTRKQGLTPLSIHAPIRVTCTAPCSSSPWTSGCLRWIASSIVMRSPVDGSTTSVRHDTHFPIAGRPARITRSPGCQPLVSLSRSSQPLGTPVTWIFRSNNFWMLSNAGFNSALIGVKPARMRESVMLKMRASERSRISAVSSLPA